MRLLRIMLGILLAVVSLHVFQNCVPSNLNLVGSPSTEGQIVAPLSIPNTRNNNSSEATIDGAGNGQGFEGKIYAETVLCDEGASKARSRIKVGTNAAWMIREACADIAPAPIVYEEIEFFEASGVRQLEYRGRNYRIEGEEKKTVTPVSNPVTPPVMAPKTTPTLRFEFGGRGEGSVVTSRGSTHQDGEHLSYVAFVSKHDRTRSTPFEATVHWDRLAGAFFSDVSIILRNKLGVDSNSYGAASVWHVKNSDDVLNLEAFQAATTGNWRSTRSVGTSSIPLPVDYVRLVGGTLPPTLVLNRKNSSVDTASFTETLNVKKGDVVLVHTTGTRWLVSSVENPEFRALKSGPSSISGFVATKDGPLAVRMKNSDQIRWGWMILVFRGR